MAVVVAVTMSGATAASAAAGSAPTGAAVAPGASADRWQGPVPTTVPMSPTDRARLQAYAAEYVDSAAGAVPGVWVGVWDPATGWAVVAAGHAQVGGADARTDDHSRIGSVTKTFVATQVLRLVDRGRLRLSDTVGRLLPEVARAHPYVARVTVRDLLGMRSGIPDYTDVPGVMAAATRHPGRAWSAAQLAEIGLAAATKRGAPAYSNTNYLLLGQIASAAGDRSIFALVNGDLRARGLAQTRLPVPGERAMPAPQTHGYNFGPGVFALAQAGVPVPVGSEQRDDVTRWGQAAGSMYSTVADLGRWAATGLGLSELSPALAAQRMRFAPINDGAIRYGLGLEDFGNGWIGHDGQAIGWEARVAYNTASAAVAVVLVNETGSLNGALGIVGHYFPDLVGT